MESWRFLDTGFNDGATNMAIDEVLATKIVPVEQTPVFRVYRWQPFTISLGYNQNPAELNLEACRRDGIEIVKRPTGGRAVFHAEEVTYSVILPRGAKLFTADILTTYNLINEGLLAGLKLYGVKAELVQRYETGKKSSDYKNQIPCFSSSAKYEIAVANKKLVGSAQRRYENSLLQHGSILTGAFHLKLADYVLLQDVQQVKRFRKALQEKTISISEITSTEVVWDEMVAALRQGLHKKFSINFFESKLTPLEVAEVKRRISTYPNRRNTL